MNNQTPHRITFLKPEHVAPIRSLQLRARCIVEGLLTGLHKSPYHGFSSQFFEYRPYHHSQPARRIDWRVYAKTQKTFTRLFEDETNLYASILLDKSASMGFRSHEALSKFEYAKTIAASLAWILIRQKDAVGLYLFDDSISASLTPHSTNTQLKMILSVLQNSEVSNKTNCHFAINSVARLLKKRGLCIVISDLFDSIDSIQQSLKHLRYKKQEVILIWLLDPLEKQFNQTSWSTMIDAETQQQFSIDPLIAQECYRKGFAQHEANIISSCKELNIDCYCITTDQPFLKAIIRILEKRRKLP